MDADSKSTITVPTTHLEKIHRVHGEYHDCPVRVPLYVTLNDALDSLLEENTLEEKGEN